MGYILWSFILYPPRFNGVIVPYQHSPPSLCVLHGGRWYNALADYYTCKFLCFYARLYLHNRKKNTSFRKFTVSQSSQHQFRANNSITENGETYKQNEAGVTSAKLHGIMPRHLWISAGVSCIAVLHIQRCTT